MTELEPLDPATAKQMYLDERRHSVAASTLQSALLNPQIALAITL